MIKILNQKPTWFGLGVFPLLLSVLVWQWSIPRFFRQETFTAATFAKTINLYISKGKVATVKELTGLANGSRGINVNARIGLLCRVLFEPQGSETIEPPGFGFLANLGSIGHPAYNWTDLCKNWPLYPVALSGSTYFVLSESYSFEGFNGPEDPKDYIAYCQAHGVFRTSFIDVPTKKEALADAAKLRGSQAWQTNWNGHSDANAWQYIQNQAETISSQ